MEKSLIKNGWNKMIDRLFMIFLVLMTIGCNIPMPKDLEMYEDENGCIGSSEVEIKMAPILTNTQQPHFYGCLERRIR